jgi:hypothetical protein
MQNQNRAIEIDASHPRCQDPVREARSLMRRSRAGILSTHSVAADGYPYGTLTRYVLTVDRRPAIRLQAIAQHTRNIVTNSRVCLTVAEEYRGLARYHARVTLIGDALRVPTDRLDQVMDEYYQTFGESDDATTGFLYYWLEPVRVRYSSDRGEAFWIEAQEWKSLVAR